MEAIEGSIKQKTPDGCNRHGANSKDRAMKVRTKKSTPSAEVDWKAFNAEYWRKWEAEHWKLGEPWAGELPGEPDPLSEALERELLGE